MNAEDRKTLRGDDVSGQIAREGEGEASIFAPNDVAFLIVRTGSVRVNLEVVAIAGDIGGSEDIGQFHDESVIGEDLDPAGDRDAIGGCGDRRGNDFNRGNALAVFVEDDTRVSGVPETVEGPTLSLVNESAFPFGNLGGIRAPVEGEATGVRGLEDFEEVDWVQSVSGDGAKGQVELADHQMIVVDVAPNRAPGFVFDRQADGVAKIFRSSVEGLLDIAADLSAFVVDLVLKHPVDVDRDIRRGGRDGTFGNQIFEGLLEGGMQKRVADLFGEPFIYEVVEEGEEQ